jgi:hypothetical protein
MAQNQQQQYSDLEVAPNQDPSSVAHRYQAGGVPEYSQYPEPVSQSEQAEKIAADQINNPDSNKVYIPAENFAPEPVPPTQEYQQSPNQYNAVPQSEAGAEAAGGAAGARAAGKRTCGMKRRTFFIVLGLALLVIVGGIAGAVVGGVTARNAALRKGSSSDGSSTNSSNVNVMGISTLSATNWTDGSNYVHRTVFFQDPWNSVLARRWDSQNQTWTTSNLTAVLANSPVPLNPQPGTSLAAAALDWPNAYRLQLYFLDPNNAVRSVFAGAPIVSPDLWQNDTLQDARLTTYPGSRLAAAWQRCAASNCVGVWAVAYQGPNAGAINVANYSDYTSPTIMLDGNKVAGNSTLALVPQFQGVQERLGLLSQSYASGTSGTMQMNSFNQTWNKSRKLDTLSWGGVWTTPPITLALR